MLLDEKLQQLISSMNDLNESLKVIIPLIKGINSMQVEISDEIFSLLIQSRSYPQIKKLKEIPCHDLWKENKSIQIASMLSTLEYPHEESTLILDIVRKTLCEVF